MTDEVTGKSKEKLLELGRKLDEQDSKITDYLMSKGLDAFDETGRFDAGFTFLKNRKMFYDGVDDSKEADKLLESFFNYKKDKQ
ncbi:MAG: hypothetical protein WC974_09155 [Thermoplasmata archaeon]